MDIVIIKQQVHPPRSKVRGSLHPGEITEWKRSVLIKIKEKQNAQ